MARTAAQSRAAQGDSASSDQSDLADDMDERILNCSLSNAEAFDELQRRANCFYDTYFDRDSDVFQRVLAIFTEAIDEARTGEVENVALLLKTTLYEVGLALQADGDATGTVMQTSLVQRPNPKPKRKTTGGGGGDAADEPDGQVITGTSYDGAGTVTVVRSQLAGARSAGQEPAQKKQRILLRLAPREAPRESPTSTPKRWSTKPDPDQVAQRTKTAAPWSDGENEVGVGTPTPLRKDEVPNIRHLLRRKILILRLSPRLLCTVASRPSPLVVQPQAVHAGGGYQNVVREVIQASSSSLRTRRRPTGQATGTEQQTAPSSEVHVLGKASSPGEKVDTLLPIPLSTPDTTLNAPATGGSQVDSHIQRLDLTSRILQRAQQTHKALDDPSTDIDTTPAPPRAAKHHPALAPDLLTPFTHLTPPLPHFPKLPHLRAFLVGTNTALANLHEDAAASPSTPFAAVLGTLVAEGPTFEEPRKARGGADAGTDSRIVVMAGNRWVYEVVGLMCGVGSGDEFGGCFGVEAERGEIMRVLGVARELVERRVGEALVGMGSKEEVKEFLASGFE